MQNAPDLNMAKSGGVDFKEEALLFKRQDKTEFIREWCGWDCLCL